jgi:hypothetical protein
MFFMSSRSSSVVNEREVSVGFGGKRHVRPPNLSLQRTVKSFTQIASAICAPLLPAAELWR